VVVFPKKWLKMQEFLLKFLTSRNSAMITDHVEINSVIPLTCTIYTRYPKFSVTSDVGWQHGR